jgi:osmoprotectant transport system ATP-binding protein
LGNPVVVFQEVTKEYARGVRALEGISFEVEEGEFFCLIGPSGCGKTTLLKMVNRLLEPTSGRIFVYGQDVRTWDPIALRRSIGYVIQQIGLFPHLTVEENMTYVLAIMGVPLKVRRQRARELLGVIGLDESYLRRFPGELSGGERQRVGVARALAADPKLIVMDEPFGALDEITRMKLQDELLELHRKLKKTILFVTHDLEEALKLSTRLGVMRGGRMLGVGRPYELLLAPPDPFVEEFLGRGGIVQVLRAIRVGDAPLRKIQELPGTCPSVSVSASLEDALRQMILAANRTLAVTEDGTGRVVGILEFEDLCRLLHRYLEEKLSFTCA